MAHDAYSDFLTQVDILLEQICGMGHQDLPDFTWFDQFNEGFTAEEAVENYAESPHGEDIKELL